jgi:hypothetical protein
MEKFIFLKGVDCMYNFPGYSELRRRARVVLRTSYWLTFLACLIFSFLGGGQNKVLSTTVSIPFGFIDSYEKQKNKDDMSDIIDFYQNNEPLTQGSVSETLYTDGLNNATKIDNSVENASPIPTDNSLGKVTTPIFLVVGFNSGLCNCFCIVCHKPCKYWFEKAYAKCGGR